jgi:hypothetical protein
MTALGGQNFYGERISAEPKFWTRHHGSRGWRHERKSGKGLGALPAFRWWWFVFFDLVEIVGAWFARNV